MKHEQFTITVKVQVCEDMKAKVLDEIRQLRLFVLGDALNNQRSVFDHAKVLKVDVDHEEVA